MNLTNVNIAIAVPISHSHIPVEFFESFMAMKKPYKHIFFRAGGYQGLDNMRNQLVDAALSYNCTHILFLDLDHRHNPDTVTKLLSHNLPIVSGLSYTRIPPFEPCLFKGIINKYEKVTKWKENELVEVDAVGAACLLINTDVFRKIKRPYFSFMKNPDPNNDFDIGEDIYFCNKVKQAGYKIYVDTGCPNKHLATLEVDREIAKIWEN